MNSNAALVPCGEGQQGDVPGLLDGAGQAALVRGANAREPAGHNLAALSHKPLQQPNIAVRDRVDLLGAELANLLAAEELATTAGSALRLPPGPPCGLPPERGAGPEPEPASGPDDACDAPESGALPGVSSDIVFPLHSLQFRPLHRRRRGTIKCPNQAILKRGPYL